jgi:hypothetical protein
VLAYLSRYTHRVAISNSQLVSFDTNGVTLRYKDYRRDGAARQQVMTLAADEFIRRFLLHVLPRGFHRIRHYGLLAASSRKTSLDLARKLLAVAPPLDDDITAEPADTRPPCPCCGGHCSLSRPSSAGLSHGHHHRAPRITGPARHEPAWLILAIRPGNRASGDNAPRPVHHHRCRRCLAWPFTTME